MLVFAPMSGYIDMVEGSTDAAGTDVHALLAEELFLRQAIRHWQDFVLEVDDNMDMCITGADNA